MGIFCVARLNIKLDTRYKCGGKCRKYLGPACHLSDLPPLLRFGTDSSLSLSLSLSLSRVLTSFHSTHPWTQSRVRLPVSRANPGSQVKLDLRQEVGNIGLDLNFWKCCHYNAGLGSVV